MFLAKAAALNLRNGITHCVISQHLATTVHAGPNPMAWLMIAASRITCGQTLPPGRASKPLLAPSAVSTATGTLEVLGQTIDITASTVFDDSLTGGAGDDPVAALAARVLRLRDLVTALETKFGRKLNASMSVDASLIGGVRVTVGDEVLDSSVSARLAHMQTVLAA